MSAPDTSKLEGKLAVMQACKDGKRMEFRNLKAGSGEWEPTGAEPMWNWMTYDYRIAPEPKVVPYTLDTCPLGATVRHKPSGERCLITATGKAGALVGAITVKYETLLRDYEKLNPRNDNWFPAGTVEGGVE